MSLSEALLLDPYPFDIWVAYRTDGLKGSGTLNDPWDGSTQARFDSVMSGLPANARVHLGPGTFQTNGYADGVSGGWQPKAGMNIVGSGIDVTTLQVVNATTAGKHFFAISHPLSSGGVPVLLDFLEVSDLTIDCNLSGGSNTGASAFGAIRVMGNHVRVSRVKAKNWGTKTGSQPCYAVAVITGDRSAGLTEVIDTGIEECIAVLPDASVSNVGPAVAFHAGGKEDAASNAEAYGKGPYIRNCFVDCGSPTATPEYRGLSIGWCRGGIVEGNQVHNTKYGGPYQDKASSRDVIVRNNYYKNVAKGPYWNLGLLNPATPTALTSLVRDLAYDVSGKTALATTSADHNLQIGERVKIDASAGPTQFKGAFVIKDVPATTQFRYQMDSDPGGTSPTSPTMQKILGIGRLVVESNTVELATGTTGLIGIQLADTEADGTSTQQTPDFRHGDVIVRQNKVRYVDGAYDPGWSGEAVKIAGAQRVVVSENVVDLANPLIRNFRCGTATYYHNTTPSGALIQGLNGVGGTKYSELETEAEDALLLTLI